MTTTNQTTDTSRNNGKPKPTHVAKIRHGYGKGATFERVGVLFQNGKVKDSFYLKLVGTQVVSKGIYLYKIDEKDIVAAEEVAPAESDEMNEVPAE